LLKSAPDNFWQKTAFPFFAGIVHLPNACPIQTAKRIFLGRPIASSSFRVVAEFDAVARLGVLLHPMGSITAWNCSASSVDQQFIYHVQQVFSRNRYWLDPTEVIINTLRDRMRRSVLLF
jgi:hypothetical protein